jgi:hypothetical protein
LAGGGQQPVSDEANIMTHVFKAVSKESTFFQLEGNTIFEEDNADAAKIVEEGG